VLRAVARYHEHRVVGLENLPDGPFILAVNHSLVTYDIGLLMLAVHEHDGRWLRALGDRIIFKTPGVRHIAAAIGVVEGNPELAVKVLGAGQCVCVAPGGMLEALRDSSERYELCWGGRKGFVRLALEANVPIVLGACPRADDVYDVWSSDFTARVYRKFRAPMPVGRGLGASAIPRPVGLVHHLSEPLYPQGDDLDALHQRVVDRMATLMESALWDAARETARSTAK
jgi:1-acyl-sn-glycerol-3-phosphate acyltransferase